ncbi:MAG: acyl-CoA reductase [Ginsengibacter sp.]
MNLEERIALLVKLRNYLTEESEELSAVKQGASEKNKWFTEEFINLSLKNIVDYFLDPEKLKKWVGHYRIDDNINPQKIGVVMAGNIPMVGFHDFLSVFITGHCQFIKLSEKDDMLLKHIIDKMILWNPKVSDVVKVSELLKNCDAYIATGSNNSARYFNYYFGKYPSVIRTNKTSVAILSGEETPDDLILLADDVFTYFGLGCRNVTKLFVPAAYNFEKLLRTFDKYKYFADISKYKNNYDYNLAILIMNNKFYMSNENIILAENENIFSPVSELHYSFYDDKKRLAVELKTDENIQCIVGEGYIPFGHTQQPGLFDYADGVDTMQFLLGL